MSEKEGWAESEAWEAAFQDIRKAPPQGPLIRELQLSKNLFSTDPPRIKDQDKRVSKWSKREEKVTVQTAYSPGMGKGSNMAGITFVLSLRSAKTKSGFSAANCSTVKGPVATAMVRTCRCRPQWMSLGVSPMMTISLAVK